MRRRLPSPAMLVALLALFVALGAGAYAATKLPKNSVKSKTIKDGEVRNQDLAPDSVDSQNIKAGAVRGPQIADGAIGPAQLDPSAIADKDLDLLKGERITVDDPADGAIQTPVVLLSYGPFELSAGCQDNGSNSTMRFYLKSTEHGWVNTSSISPDDFEAGVSQPLGQQTLSADSTAGSGGYAVTDSGRFMQVGVIGIAKPGGSTDCIFHTSGWGG